MRWAKPFLLGCVSSQVQWFACCPLRGFAESNVGMSRLSFHKSLLTMSFGMTFAALTVVARSQTLPHDTTTGRLETVATFNGPMLTGVTVSQTNRIFVNFP
jgi:hypothetical protein